MKSKRPIQVAKNFNLLNEFVQAVNLCETEDEIYKHLALALPKFVAADHASIAIIDNAHAKLDRYDLFESVGLGKKNALPKGRVHLTNKTIAGLALLKHSTIVTEPSNSDCSKCGAQADCVSFSKAGYVACMATPIYIRGKIVGTIIVASHTANVYTKNSIRVFEVISLFISACLENIQSIRVISSSQNRRGVQAKRLKMLTDISLQLSHAKSEKDMVQSICDYFIGPLSAENLNYVIVDKKHRKFTRTHFFVEGELHTGEKTFPMEGSSLLQVLREGIPKYYSAFSDIEFVEMGKLGVNHAWSIPIFENNEVSGVLNLGWSVEPYFKEDLIDIFTILSSLISVALENVRATEVISYRANYDLLTGAHNRHSFQGKMCDLMNENPAIPFTLLIVDLDGFKQLNDFHGHLFGDKVLAEIVKHFQTIFGKQSYVARLGGDEFAIIGDFTRYKTSMLNGMKLNTMKIEHDGRVIPVGFSAGIAHYPRHTEDTSKLMKYADIALYEAKASTSNIKVFKSSMAKQYKRKFELLNEFKIALSNEKIIPFYQPIIDLKTNKLHALEALARWDHSKQGVLSPADFSDIFEVPKLSGKIAYVMHSRICKDMARWKNNGIEFKQVGLNVETVNLLDPAFPIHLIAELEKNGLKASEYAIELTENFILDSQNKCILENLNALRLAGMGIFLDDFGTGFSSISHLKDLPITSLKLDRSYVVKSMKCEKDYHIVNAIISLADKLNIKTVAEGIETEEAKRLFVSLKCNYGQGFLFARPLSAHEVPDFINNLNRNKLAVIAA